ncbi:MAG: hypothetical protein IT318_22985 [Anaerolineales bacterium]|nr:hypothetical protein [Anaerolineales bacterium]
MRVVAIATPASTTPQNPNLLPGLNSWDHYNHYAKHLGGFKGFNEETAKLPKYTEKWLWVSSIKRLVERERLLEWDREQFDAWHAVDFSRGKASQHLLSVEEFERVESATYSPEEGLIVVENGESKLNYWRPSGLTPAPGSVAPFLEHINYLYPTGNEGEILLKYLAYQVQKPGKKVHWAVLLEGLPGNGKSYFAMAMTTVLGEHNVRMVSNEELHETFTGWQRNTQLVVVEEMMARQRLELMNKLKPMITEPWCSIREMYRPPYKQPNRFNFLFFSNHNNALILDEADRRYCILKTLALPREPKYYAHLFDWTRRNGPALLWYLKTQVDLSNFPAKAHAPMTEGKRAMIRHSMPDMDSYVYDQVEAVAYPCRWDLLRPADLVGPLKEKGIRATPRTVAAAFERLGYLDLGVKRLMGETKSNLWAVRNFDDYRGMDTARLRAVWAAQTNGDPKESGKDAEEAIARAMGDERRAYGDPFEFEKPM